MEITVRVTLKTKQTIGKTHVREYVTGESKPHLL